MKKILATWIPLFVVAAVFFFVIIMNMNPKTYFGYELTTTPMEMKIWGWIILACAATLGILMIAEGVTWVRSRWWNQAITITIIFLAIIFALLFFINFSFDINNPY